MRHLSSLVGLLALSGLARAHVADMPPLLHALDHGWLVMAAALPALLLLLPLRRRGRR